MLVKEGGGVSSIGTLANAGKMPAPVEKPFARNEKTMILYAGGHKKACPTQ